MSIFDIFRPAAPTAPADPASNANPQNTGLPGTESSPTTAPNGVVPEQTTEPKSNSPLDKFADIWKTEPATGKEPTTEGFFANLDPAKVMESAKQVDFTKTLTPELLTKINGGGADAMQAMVEAMNNVAQTTYARSALATTKIVEQALGRAQEQYDSRIPDMVRKFSANESILADNPLLSNPALQPLVGALQEQLVRKNPQATSAEIRDQVTAYFSALGTTFAPKPVQSKSSASKSAGEDWGKFFS